jgi:hypothetical protein
MNNSLGGWKKSYFRWGYQSFELKVYGGTRSEMRKT